MTQWWPSKSSSSSSSTPNQFPLNFLTKLVNHLLSSDVDPNTDTKLTWLIQDYIMFPYGRPVPRPIEEEELLESPLLSLNPSIIVPNPLEGPTTNITAKHLGYPISGDNGGRENEHILSFLKRKSVLEMYPATAATATQQQQPGDDYVHHLSSESHPLNNPPTHHKPVPVPLVLKDGSFPNQSKPVSFRLEKNNLTSDDDDSGDDDDDGNGFAAITALFTTHAPPIASARSHDDLSVLEIPDATTTTTTTPSSTPNHPLTLPTHMNPIAYTFTSILYNFAFVTQNLPLLALVTAPIWVEWEERLEMVQNQINRLIAPTDKDLIRDIALLFNLSPTYNNLQTYIPSVDDSGLRGEFVGTKLRCHLGLLCLLLTSSRHHALISSQTFPLRSATHHNHTNSLSTLQSQSSPTSPLSTTSTRTTTTHHLTIPQLCIIFCLPGAIQALRSAGIDVSWEKDVDGQQCCGADGNGGGGNGGLCNQFKLRAKWELFSLSFSYWQLDPYPSMGYDDVEAFELMFDLVMGKGGGTNTKENNNGQNDQQPNPTTHNTNFDWSFLETPPQTRPPKTVKSSVALLLPLSIVPSETTTTTTTMSSQSASTPTTPPPHYHPFFQALLTGSTKILSFLIRKGCPTIQYQIDPERLRGYEDIIDWQQDLLGSFVFHPALSHCAAHYYYDNGDNYRAQDVSSNTNAKINIDNITNNHNNILTIIATINKTPSNLLTILFELCPDLKSIPTRVPINSLLRLAMTNLSPCCLGLWNHHFQYDYSPHLTTSAQGSLDQLSLGMTNTNPELVSPSTSPTSFPPDGPSSPSLTSPNSTSHSKFINYQRILPNLTQTDTNPHHSTLPTTPTTTPSTYTLNNRFHYAIIRFLLSASDAASLDWTVDTTHMNRPVLVAHDSATRSNGMISSAMKRSIPVHSGEHSLHYCLDFFLAIPNHLINPDWRQYHLSTEEKNQDDTATTTTNHSSNIHQPANNNITTTFIFPKQILWKCAYTRYGCKFEPGIKLRPNHTITLLAWAMIGQERIQDVLVNLLLKQSPPPNLLASITIQGIVDDEDDDGNGNHPSDGNRNHPHHIHIHPPSPLEPPPTPTATTSTNLIFSRILPLFLALKLTTASDTAPPAIEAMIHAYIESILIGQEGEHHYRIDLPLNFPTSCVDWDLAPVGSPTIIGDGIATEHGDGVYHGLNKAPARKQWQGGSR